MLEPVPTGPMIPEGGFAAISKYNPHLWSAAQLRAIFVARQQELADLQHNLRNNPSNQVGQHVLLVGPRGMGKSTLMQRLALAVEDDAALCAAWLPLRFPEEQYTVNTLGQFWANVLGSLADAMERQGAPTAELDASAERIAQLPASEQAAAYLQAINQCADQRGQRLLLLVDNTDLLLHNIGSKAHWALREVLQSNARLLWVGGSYQSLEANSHYHDAFLDFFQVMELRPLRIDEMQQALLALAHTFGGEEAESAMQTQLIAHPERLATLRQLSGGNPRTTVMLYELFSGGQAGQVRSDLEALLDNMTPLYKGRLDALAELPRKLLAHILEHWAPMSLAGLTQASQVPKSSISPQLQRLELEGLIQKTKLQGTTRNGYQTAERFFNIWYLMRLSPRRQRNRLGWLVEFMRLWFSADELHGLAQGRLSHSSVSRQQNHDWEYDRALADALPPDHNLRHALRWNLLKQLQDQHSELAKIFELDGEDRDFKSADDYLQRLKPLPALLRLCPHAKTEEEKVLWADGVMGSYGLDLSAKERLANTAKRLSSSQYEQVNMALKNVARQVTKEIGNEAAQKLRSLILERDFFPDMPDSRLAFEQIRAGFTGETEKLIRFVAFQHFSHHQDLWLLKTLEWAQLAMPGSADIAFQRGWLKHQKLGRYVEAEIAYRDAIAMDGKSTVAWNALGNLLQNHLKRFHEAEDAYREAITLDEKFADPWNGLGNLFQNHLNRHKESETAYRKAIELNEKYAYPWIGLGYLLQQHLSQYSQAEVAFRRAIALDDKNAHAWSGLGFLLTDLSRYNEAETAFSHAISLNQQNANYWADLGNLLQDYLLRESEAEIAYRRAILLEPTSGYPKINLARLLWKQDRRPESEMLFREVSNIARPVDHHFRLQAHLSLGNQQLALDELLNMVHTSRHGKTIVFYQLKEQVCEVSELGLGETLAQWMAESSEAAFLQPFIQALYMLAGATDKLQDLPQEIQLMADEVVEMAKRRNQNKLKIAAIPSPASTEPPATAA